MKSALIMSALAVASMAAPRQVWSTTVITEVVYVDQHGKQFSSTIVPASSQFPSNVPQPTPTPSSTSQAAAATAALDPHDAQVKATDQYAPLGDSNYEGSYNGPGWARGVLAHHNIHRANHSAPLLKWDKDLANDAWQQADSCQWEHTNKYVSGKFGKDTYMNNLITVSDGDWFNFGLHTSNGWYNGEFRAWQAVSNNFDPSFANPDSSRTTDDWGHFSQMVWKDHSVLGCALVDCSKEAGKGGLIDASSGKLMTTVQGYMVCNYAGLGNMGGEYAKNVLPPLGWPVVDDKSNNFYGDLATTFGPNDPRPAPKK